MLISVQRGLLLLSLYVYADGHRASKAHPWWAFSAGGGRLSSYADTQAQTDFTHIL